MLINSHLAIGSYCYKICNEKYNLNLNKRNFLYGFIEPDLHKRKNKIKHTYSVSKDKMGEYKRYIENNDLSIDEISFIVGQIAHYIADCFCKYHLEEYYGKDMMEHFKYEVILHRILKKTLSKNEQLFENILDDIEETGCYLEKLKSNRKDYLDLDEDCINDIYFTIKTTCELLYATQGYFVKVMELYG